MHYNHVSVFAAVLCSTALCFAQAQAPKTTEVKGTQSGQAAVVKSSPDTAKQATHLPVTADTTKKVKSVDTVKTHQSAVVPGVDTTNAPQAVDTGKTAGHPKTKLGAKKTAHIDTAKAVAPVDTAKPAKTAPAIPAAK